MSGWDGQDESEVQLDGMVLEGSSNPMCAAPCM